MPRRKFPTLSPEAVMRLQQMSLEDQTRIVETDLLDESGKPFIFRRNPYAEYDPQHLWVGMHSPRQNYSGSETPYRISDRIWHANNDSRRRMDGTLRRGIREGLSVTEIAGRLERNLRANQRRFLSANPHLNLRRDRNGNPVIPIELAIDSYLNGQRIAYAHAALRLATTEVSRAFNQAEYTASMANPLAVGVDWQLAPAHPVTDICDTFATLDGGGNRIADAYPFGSARIPPAHPWCLCRCVTAMPSEGQINARLDYLQLQLQDALREEVVPIIGIDNAIQMTIDLVQPSLLQLTDFISQLELDLTFGVSDAMRTAIDIENNIPF